MISEDALDRACRAWAAADPTGPRDLSSYSFMGAMTLRTRMRAALAAAAQPPVPDEDAQYAANGEDPR